MAGSIEELFSQQIDEDVFHDTVLEATNRSLNHDDLISVFKTLPEQLQSLAMSWCLSDTDFNLMALKFLKENNGGTHIMADDYIQDDDDCMSCEAFKNPMVQNTIEKTVDAFFEAIEKTDLEAGDGMVAAAAAVASIADAIYIGIQECADQENIEGVGPDEFRQKFLSMVEDYLDTLMNVDVEEDDDEEDMIPLSVTTH